MSTLAVALFDSTGWWAVVLDGAGLVTVAGILVIATPVAVSRR